MNLWTRSQIVCSRTCKVLIIRYSTGKMQIWQNSPTLHGRGTLILWAGSKIQFPFLKLVKSNVGGKIWALFQNFDQLTRQFLFTLIIWNIMAADIDRNFDNNSGLSTFYSLWETITICATLIGVILHPINYIESAINFLLAPNVRNVFSTNGKVKQIKKYIVPNY